MAKHFCLLKMYSYCQTVLLTGTTSLDVTKLYPEMMEIQKLCKKKLYWNRVKGDQNSVNLPS